MSLNRILFYLNNSQIFQSQSNYSIRHYSIQSITYSKKEVFYQANMPDLINESAQISSAESILLPMCSLFPANQIITKQYRPDQAPIMKLITKQAHKQKQQKRLPYNLSEPKICGPEFSQYADLFGSQDFLGSYYADKFDQIVYFKFNNKDYNQLKIVDKKCRFFSGFFIDRQHFQEVGLQKFDNIMKSFPGLDFVDYSSNFLQSFGKNTKGNLQDPKFSSNYDSANLFAVIKIRPFQYDLILQNDINSKGNTQWFNFLVHFTEEGTYKFNIVNFTKTHSLYQDGMKIACYSFSKQSYRGNHENQKAGSGWFKGGKNIQYFRNGIQRQTLGSNESYYTLSFDFTCKNRAESFMFAHSVPYSGLQLQKYFNKMLYRRVTGHLKMEKIFVCNSLAGQPVNAYIISHRKSRSNSLKFKNAIPSPQQIQKAQKPKTFNFSKIMEKKNNPNEAGQQVSQLKSVILMARQHPGETQSSFVLEGIVDFLMANNQLDQIKKNYVFFIIPMVNVDGVKYGHYRTNLSGSDPNRVWRVPKKQINPQVYHVKKLMFEINRNYPVTFILDIHGHSKSLNSFFYGNPSKKQNLSFDDPKIFPFICSKRIKQVSYKQSTFNIRQQKKNSARVALSEMFPKALVYTLQNSFYGFTSKISKQDAQTNQQDQVTEFTPEGYRRVGREIMSTYLEYTRLCQKNTTIKAKWMKQMQGIYSEMEKSRTVQFPDDGGSDSELENELIQIQQKPLYRPIQAQKHELNIFKSVKTMDILKTNFYQKRNCIFRRTQKKKTMPLPKTICQQNVRGMTSHNSRSYNDLGIKQKQLSNIQGKQNKLTKNSLNITSKPEYPQAVLSIFKIQTQKSAILRKKTTINSILGYQELMGNKFINEKQKISPQTNLFSSTNANKAQKQEQKIAIHQKKRQQMFESEKKMNVEQVINKCSGMKTFLKAMGITIENRKV